MAMLIFPLLPGRSQRRTRLTAREAIRLVQLLLPLFDITSTSQKIIQSVGNRYPSSMSFYTV